MKSNKQDDTTASNLVFGSSFRSINSKKIKASSGVFFLTLIFILFEYFNGGVISHHLLAREDLPAFSNWWGLLTMPLLFWIAISIIDRRQEKNAKLNSKPKKYRTIVFKRFLVALGFGIILSLLWEFNFENVLLYIISFPFLIAFFKPIHLPENFMGFVLGMLFTFGGVLPILIGSIILSICFIINKLIGVLKILVFKIINKIES